jgi:prepilin-type N-terminal cleavage/methylation domain-containing protein
MTIEARLSMHKTAFHQPSMPASGFSLLEMAVVLLIVSILMSGVFVAISDSAGSARRSATLSQLRQIEEALYGFAQSQGRLPCPATASSNGYEDTSGGCAGGHGYIPNATLGLYGQVDSNGVLVDVWQNPLRYAVATTGSPDFTDSSSIRNFFGTGAPVTALAQTIKICSTIAGGTCTGAAVITDTAPAVVFSMGANWNSFTSVQETENADLDATVVSATYSEAQFDDQLLWLSPYVLFNRMLSAGKLP